MAATPEQKRAYYERNRQKVIDNAAKWRRENPEKYAAQRRPINAKRRAAKLQRTPPWCEEKQIKALYKFASWLTKEHGRAIHVDHIVPLQHDLVCGLHCMDNLQLLYAEDNLAKSNSYTIN